MLRHALILTAALLGACSAPEAEEARRAWLVDALVQDNLTWMSRDEALLANKYATMAADPYDFMRGTAGVFFQDLSRPGTARTPTGLLSATGVAELLLVGDPHPENLGSFRVGPGPGPTLADPFDVRGEGVVFDFNDLDGSHYGPYLLDLRRAAVGLSILAAPLEGCEADCVDRIVEALALAYAEEIAAPGSVDVLAEAARQGVDGSADSGDTAEERSRGVAILRALFEEAVGEGAERKRLLRYAELGEDGELSLLTDEGLDEEGAGMLPLSAEERAQVARLAAAYAEVSPEPFHLLGAVRRYGSGVASRPAVRYVWLWDRGQAGPEDDQLMVVREVVDPSRIPGLQASVGGLFDSQAVRIELAPQLLWGDPETDYAARGLSDGSMTFKAVSWSSWFQGFDHAKIAEEWGGDYVEADLIGLARFLGGALGGAHGRAPVASGGRALSDLQDQLEGRTEALRDELVSTARADAARCLDDHALFVEALEDLGPLLGAERLQ
ncbi:MAG: DUF2252 family protein [Alphaproteobacteria bacterium]|nr:DUF2252 family protein [Alphaproteobacteria bacterium]